MTYTFPLPIPTLIPARLRLRAPRPDDFDVWAKIPGYFFRPTAEGRGYATEAAVAARDHTFAAFGSGRLVSHVDPRNAASGRLARRIGASLEGDLDGSQVWAHRPVAQTAVSARGETEGRPKEDAWKTSEKGD